jgi:hypothetical protein
LDFPLDAVLLNPTRLDGGRWLHPTLNSCQMKSWVGDRHGSINHCLRFVSRWLWCPDLDLNMFRLLVS